MQQFLLTHPLLKIHTAVPEKVSDEFFGLVRIIGEGSANQVLAGAYLTQVLKNGKLCKHLRSA